MALVLPKPFGRLVGSPWCYYIMITRLCFCSACLPRSSLELLPETVLVGTVLGGTRTAEEGAASEFFSAVEWHTCLLR